MHARSYWCAAAAARRTGHDTVLQSDHAAAQPSGCFTWFSRGTWVLQRDPELGEDGATQHGADEDADDGPPVEDAEDALVQLCERRCPALRLWRA